ncbi:MAG: DNA helicase II [bacterium]|nr:DNA helicase II [bacterium]
MAQLPPLDASQEAFCKSGSGNIRLLAPAGCGKTHSLLWRCLHLADSADNEKTRFLIFTFTRAARDELRDRIKRDKAFAGIAPMTSITTLNSWGFRRLKSNLHNPKLAVEGAQRYMCLNNILQPVWMKYDRIRDLLEDSRRRNQASRVIMDLIDKLKTLGFRHDQIRDTGYFTTHTDWLAKAGMGNHVKALFQQLLDLELLRDDKDVLKAVTRHFLNFWREACDHMYRSAFITLEDQKYWPWVEIDQQVAEEKFHTGTVRYHHVLVDEFQDINPLDLNLVRSIAAVNKATITIVGDDDQAIYEWRGATPSFILKPKGYLEGPFKTFILGTNYRSPRNIVELSQKLIAHNRRREAKEVRPAGGGNAKVDVVGVANISESVDFVLNTVRNLLKGGDCRNVAIIGRKRSQIIPYQIVFAGESIPFYAAEDLQVFLSDAFNELKGMLAIRARLDSKSIYGEDPIHDLLTLCDKVKRFPISKKDRDTLAKHLRQAKPKNFREAAVALFSYNGPLKGENLGGRMSSSFADAIGHFIKAETVSDCLQAMSENLEGLKKDYGKSIDDIFYTEPPFLHLSEYAQRYRKDYVAFYEDIEKAAQTLALVPSDDEEEQPEASWKLPLHLMTALRAKGKEFDAVIILDANDGIWPSRLSQTEEELEQERRVFYVAMTRARKRLTFLVNERMLKEAVVPTPYLAEMGLLTR